MRVLVVTQYFWPEDFSINSVVRSLIDRGIEVEVLTGKPNYPEGIVFKGYKALGCQAEHWHGVKIHRLPVVPRGSKSALRLIFNYISFVLSGIFLAPWLLQKRSFDSVLVYAPSPILQAIPGIFLGWLKKCGVIVWVQDLWPESLTVTGYINKAWILSIVRFVVRWIYFHADLLLLQSRAFESPVATMAPNTPRFYHPNSVDSIFAQPPSPNVKLPLLPSLEVCFTVMFAGNLGSAQAVEVIVEVALLLSKVNGIQFIVVGQGSRWTWMRDQVQALGLTNIHLLGRFPLETMPSLLQKADALLVTLSDEPILSMTVPNKIQAYMAVGRPILASLNGEGARLIHEAQAGFCTPAEDPQLLAAAVMKLYQMTVDDRLRMGVNGRRYFESYFDQSVLVEDLIKHLSFIAGLKGSVS